MILSTVFSGNTTAGYIKKYTTGSYPGYNFTNAWTVESPGIPREIDGVATGYYYMSDNTTQTPIAAADKPVKISGTTTSSNPFRVKNPSNNRLDYEGNKSRSFEITCTGTVDNTSGPNKRTYTFYIYKNGERQNAISAQRTFTNSDIGNFTLIGSLNLVKNDYIEVYAENTGNSNDILVTRLSLILK